LRTAYTYLNNRNGALISSLFETLDNYFMNITEEDKSEVLEHIKDNSKDYTIKKGFILKNGYYDD
jgi:hypothetical protein